MSVAYDSCIFSTCNIQGGRFISDNQLDRLINQLHIHGRHGNYGWFINKVGSKVLDFILLIDHL